MVKIRKQIRNLHDTIRVLIADDHALLSQYDPLNLAGRSTDSRRLL